MKASITSDSLSRERKKQRIDFFYGLMSICDTAVYVRIKNRLPSAEEKKKPSHFNVPFRQIYHEIYTPLILLLMRLYYAINRYTYEGRK